MAESKLFFSRSLYADDAVFAAVEAYEQLATFVVSTREHDLEVTVSNLNPDFEGSVVDEFSNHVLYETVQRRREAASAQPGVGGA